MEKTLVEVIDTRSILVGTKFVRTMRCEGKDLSLFPIFLKTVNEISHSVGTKSYAVYY